MSNALLPLRELIEAHDLWPKKSLGQHFLLDTNLLAKIVRAAGDISEAHVIEVGPDRAASPVPFSRQGRATSRPSRKMHDALLRSHR